MRDSGIAGFVLIARYLGIPANPDQIRHQLGLATSTATASDLLRVAKSFHLKARLVTARLDRLSKAPLPAIAELRDGQFCIIGRVLEGKVLVQHAGRSAAELVPIDEFTTVWSGRLLLMVRRASPGSFDRRFGLAWFLPAVVKYRRVLSEVLISSLVLQVIALASPIFFQVVIDKVLVHRGLDTLDVLAIGLVTLSL